ncbi:hypothetical protein [Achromobacter animicus]|uniref:hypothetical protein n=1 Tax=Achromobacter animicus TaxID=1389935 RepID=UPI00244A4068|nr:hypothetical protein [Achromobacter animicus]MDH0682940.1 hypothetical protein [Achromobacter animicus]
MSLGQNFLSRHCAWSRWRTRVKVALGALTMLGALQSGPLRAQTVELEILSPSNAEPAPKPIARQQSTDGRLREVTRFGSSMGAAERQDFVREAQDLLRGALASYALKERAPLQAQVFDIEHPLLGRALSTSTGRPLSNFLNYFMAMQFYPQVEVNKVRMPFCFILFNESRAGTLSSSLFQSRADWLAYAVMHESGHCFLAHQRYLGRIGPMSGREEEAFADMFAMGYALASGNPDAAKAILKLQESLTPITTENDHYEPASRAAFLKRWLDAPPAPRDIYDLFTVTASAFDAVKPR